MGKGSRPRPLSVSTEEFDKSFDTIFGKKEPRKQWVPPPVVIQEPPKQKITFGDNKEENK